MDGQVGGGRVQGAVMEGQEQGDGGSVKEASYYLHYITCKVCTNVHTNTATFLVTSVSGDDGNDNANDFIFL